jgi:ubiquinone/menaquinone biosynthesis C-methylase UbiE
MTLDSEKFEVNRWHSPEYIEPWMADRTMEEGRRIMQKKLVSLLPFDPEATIRVLDVGTGTGALSLAILGTYPKAQVVCHDFSEAMLAHARKQLVKFQELARLWVIPGGGQEE